MTFQPPVGHSNHWAIGDSWWARSYVHVGSYTWERFFIIYIWFPYIDHYSIKHFFWLLSFLWLHYACPKVTKYQVYQFFMSAKNLHIKFITLLSVNESTYSIYWSSFLYLYGIQIFPFPSQLRRRNKKYMSSLYFHKSRRPRDALVKRAGVVWKLRALKFNMAVTMNFFTTWRSFLKLFCRYIVQPKQRMFGIMRWRSSGVPIEKIRTIWTCINT